MSRGCGAALGDWRAALAGDAAAGAARASC